MSERNFETQSLRRKMLFLFYFQNALYNFLMKQDKDWFTKRKTQKAEKIVYQSGSGKETEIPPDFNKENLT